VTQEVDSVVSSRVLAKTTKDEAREQFTFVAEFIGPLQAFSKKRKHSQSR